jgi:hypothetical protein
VLHLINLAHAATPQQADQVVLAKDFVAYIHYVIVMVKMSFPAARKPTWTELLNADEKGQEAF